jgi:hypothetical protein
MVVAELRNFIIETVGNIETGVDIPELDGVVLEFYGWKVGGESCSLGRALFGARTSSYWFLYFFL